MKRIISNKKIILVTSFIFSLTFIFLFSQIEIPKTIAQGSNQKLSGYAWSDTIGWISFASTTNGNNLVEIDVNGNVSGYAWSDNIGWIKFGGLSGFPSSGSNAQVSGTNLNGWARACSGTVNKDCDSADRTDGWDGWIKLDGVTLDGNDSYAWGSDVVGWVNFKSVILSQPNALTCAYNNQNMQVLPSQGYLCTNGVSSTYPDNLELNETQIEDITPNGTDIYDYQYNWACGGNSCSVTTELKNSANSTYALDARLAPAIVQKTTDLCTAEWNTPENYNCVVKKSDGTDHIDASSNSGHQLEVGNGYYVYCTESVPTTGIIYKSQTMTCLLNPTIKEI